MRQIVLDTETTGLEVAAGHRIIEIGAVELIDRKFTGRQFHKYVNPEREIDDGAFEVHGLSTGFLADKPRFAEIAAEFLDFIIDSELVIHNAPFDLSFLDDEFARLPELPGKLERLCRITDSLALARHKHPGQKNNLDALCRRYSVDNSARTLHGALLDAEILADVYLLMTGGQTALFGSDTSEGGADAADVSAASVRSDRPALKIIVPSGEETDAHEAWLDELDKRNTSIEGGGSIWRRYG